MSTSCSMFSQILKLIPRADFARIVKETQAEHRSKGLSSWSRTKVTPCTILVFT
ncbi:MAG: DUF4372 domain-containing protein [Gallionella sp.]|nr:DUF4372 domain-containing protein [Gallionella sp.]